MLYVQRCFAHIKLREMLPDLYGNAFEKFFHDLMCARHPDFLDVRTHGTLGDQGSDGLSLHDGKLYACYAPATFDATGVRGKFRKDLASALSQRPGQFTVFVFVHNDLRGVHPEIATMLVDARKEHPGLTFEQMGRRRLWLELQTLTREAVETVLGCPIPIDDPVYGIGMEDLAPLLAHLKERRQAADPLGTLDEVSQKKFDFNRISGDVRQNLVAGMRHTHLVAEYYAGVYDPGEHDEVAAGFAQEYLNACEEGDGSEDILLLLQFYVHGNRLQNSRDLAAGWTVLAYFFERCHIFDDAPTNWNGHTAASEVV
jgi:hypothetical protein